MSESDKCEWKCQKCEKIEVVDEYKYNSKKCSCGYWMTWHILSEELQ